MSPRVYRLRDRRFDNVEIRSRGAPGRQFKYGHASRILLKHTRDNRCEHDRRGRFDNVTIFSFGRLFAPLFACIYTALTFPKRQYRAEGVSFSLGPSIVSPNVIIVGFGTRTPTFYIFFFLTQRGK